MSSSLLSPHWYRIGGLRPSLRAGVRQAVHTVRGEAWVVLTDPVSGRHHRFDAAAWRLLQRCDGRTTIDTIWARLGAEDEAALPTQEQTIAVFAQAFAAQLLVGDVTPEAAQLLRARARDRQRRRRAALNPLAFRVPLWNPDRFLARHLPLVAPLLGRTGVRLLGALALLGLVLALLHGPALAAHVATLAEGPRGWLLAWLLYPLLKMVHELAHGFAVKRHGGEVPTIGITLMVLTPVPYVDASASAALPGKHQRAGVAAAGIVAELVLATLALLLWLAAEPGLVRDAAAVAATVAGLSTLLVNGNPLLRFDGYHVACDLLELPNLAARSQRWWAVLAQRRLLALPGVAPLRLARGERPWLVAYAPAAWAMRALLLAMAVAVLAGTSALLAGAVALLALWALLLAPLARLARWLLRAPELRGHRGRATGWSMAGTAGLALLLFALPLPHHTHAPGLTWLPDNALVRVQADGLVERFEAADGQRVEPGQVIAVLADPRLDAAVAGAAAELERARIEHRRLLDGEAGAAVQAAHRAEQLQAEHDRLRHRQKGLVVRAASAGRLVLDPRRPRVGQWLAQGELLAHVLPDGPPMVRAFLHNDRLQPQRPWQTAAVQLPHDPRLHPARASGGTPQASRLLPSAALGEGAGGSIVLDPADPQRRTAAAPHLQLDFVLPPEVRAPVGARVLVRLDHGHATLAERGGWLLRRLFLRHVGA